ncbi:MAG: DoxX family protein [Planctomycetota bacterium]|nr:MAG: DoxX family protein [Planctomycetota bacterium]
MARTHTATILEDGRRTVIAIERAPAATILVPLGRALFAAIFLSAAPGHFGEESIAMSAQQGLPMAVVLVPASGVWLLIGGLAVLLGIHARLGALMLALFLIPATYLFHDFWNVADPAEAHIQQIMFMKNLAMLGGALLLAYYGAGPWSLDSWRYTRPRRP